MRSHATTVQTKNTSMAEWQSPGKDAGRGQKEELQLHAGPLEDERVISNVTVVCCQDQRMQAAARKIGSEAVNVAFKLQICVLHHFPEFITRHQPSAAPSTRWPSIAL